MKSRQTESPIEMIAEERERQINQEGYSPEHDDEHDGGELALAAAVYAAPGIFYSKQEYANSIVFDVMSGPYNWTLQLPHNGNLQLPNRTLSTSKRIDQLVKAGGLIIAEIERLQRLKEAK